jgi:hypothetical protein
MHERLFLFHMNAGTMPFVAMEKLSVEKRLIRTELR